MFIIKRAACTACWRALYVYTSVDRVHDLFRRDAEGRAKVHMSGSSMNGYLTCGKRHFDTSHTVGKRIPDHRSKHPAN